MNQLSFSKAVRQQISETVSDFTARETANLSRECSSRAMQNMANSNLELAHFYLALAKELMIIAVRRKEELKKINELVSAAAN